MDMKILSTDYLNNHLLDKIPSSLLLNNEINAEIDFVIDYETLFRYVITYAIDLLIDGVAFLTSNTTWDKILQFQNNRENEI